MPMRLRERLFGAVVLLLGSLAMGQAPSPQEKPGAKPEKAPPLKPLTLEEMITQALAQNPDIRVAEAKVEEAEAELDRVRLLVIQKIVATRAAADNARRSLAIAESGVDLASAQVAAAEAHRNHVVKLHQKGLVPEAEVRPAELKVQTTRADLLVVREKVQAAQAEAANAQAGLQFLLGKPNQTPGLPGSDTGFFAGGKRSLRGFRFNNTNEPSRGELQIPKGPMAQTIKQRLAEPRSMAAQDHTLPQILKILENVADIPILDNTTPKTGLSGEFKASIKVADASLFALCQMISDKYGIQIGVREYGFLVAEKLPPGVPTLDEFLKAP